MLACFLVFQVPIHAPCVGKNVFSDELFSFVIGGNGRMVGTSNNSVHVSPTGFDGD